MSMPTLYYGLAVVSFVLFVWASANQQSLKDKRQAELNDQYADATATEWAWLIASLVFLIAIPFLVALGVGA